MGSVAPFQRRRAATTAGSNSYKKPEAATYDLADETRRYARTRGGVANRLAYKNGLGRLVDWGADRAFAISEADFISADANEYVRRAAERRFCGHLGRKRHILK